MVWATCDPTPTTFCPPWMTRFWNRAPACSSTGLLQMSCNAALSLRDEPPHRQNDVASPLCPAKPDGEAIVLVRTAAGCWNVGAGAAALPGDQPNNGRNGG